MSIGVKIRGKRWVIADILKDLMVSFVLVAITVFLLSNIVRGVLATSEKLEIYNRSQEGNSKLRLENIRLIAEENRVMSEDFIEQAARDRLGYAKEGEIVIVIPEEVMESEELETFYDSIVNGADEVTVKGGLDVWLKLFVDGL